MPIDTSIYSNLKPVQLEAPNPLQSMQQAMSLGQMGMQQMALARQMRNQADIQQALYQSTDPQTGQLDQKSYLSTLGKTNPLMAQQESGRLAANNEALAKSQAAQLDAANKALNITGPALEYFSKNVPQDQKAQVYPQLIEQLKSQGVDVTNLDHPYDPQLEKNQMMVWANNKGHWENLLAQASIPAKQAEINATIYGSRSPNAELTSQYNDQAKSVRGSQMAMNQMLDNYKNPSPQGDASLILNAFKIKFPNAPDVNSLEELSKSQAAPDQFKQWANKALAGGLDPNTRDNLMRDGISTFRANVNTLRGVQQKMRGRQQVQGVNDPSLTYEPGIDATYQETQDLQKQLGPYKPPAERGGISGAIAGAISKLAGTGGSQPAQAQEKPKYRQSGATVSADELAQYATKHGMKLKDAQSFLKGQGYVIGR